MRAFAPAESHPKPLQSHILGIYKAYTPEYKATPKPPQSLLIANRLGPQSHLKATLKPHQSHTKATPKPHQSHTKATPKPHQSHTKATPKPHQGYPKATPRLPQSHPHATPKPGNRWLHRSYSLGHAKDLSRRPDSEGEILLTWARGSG